MKGILALAAAVVLVLVQLGAFAMWSVAQAMDHVPSDGPQSIAEHRA